MLPVPVISASSNSYLVSVESAASEINVLKAAVLVSIVAERSAAPAFFKNFDFILISSQNKIYFNYSADLYKNQ